MALTMDISLDYGAWPSDGGVESTGSPASCDESFAPIPLSAHDNDHSSTSQSRQDVGSRRQQSAAWSFADFFSDPADSGTPDKDFLTAELNMASAASSSQILPNTSQSPHFSYPTNSLASSTRPSNSLPAAIDLTTSPPHSSARPTNNSWQPGPIPSLPQHQSTMAAHLSDYAQPRRAPLAPGSSSQPEGYSRKRRRLSHTPQPVSSTAPEVEAVDLTDVHDRTDIAKVISKQQQDAVQAQMKDHQDEHPTGRTPLSSYKCPICMDTPEDATSTVCGHLFCHKCIIDTLRFSEQQRRDDMTTSKAKGTCPVCRKPLARKDEPGNGRTLVPLEIKMSTKRDLKGKGVVGRSDPTHDYPQHQNQHHRHRQHQRSHQEPSSSSSSIPNRMLAKTERESSADMWRDLTTLEHV